MADAAPPDFAGRVAVVTGGGGGLGTALARVFAGAGMGVAAPDIDDVAMLAHQPMAEGDVVEPAYAVRNLLADLVADVRYSLTHGSYRPVYDARRAALDAAFDRMEGS